MKLKAEPPTFTTWLHRGCKHFWIQTLYFRWKLVVEKLFLKHKVVCRFPAIAFRLLDFPTLMIYHVEPNLGDTIKAKIYRRFHTTKLAPQLHELQDKDGNFSVKKGKSSLFRVTPNTLLNHLTNHPTIYDAH